MENEMTQEREAKILERAVKTYGGYAQVDMAIEEMAELTKALLKHRRALDAVGTDGLESLKDKTDDVLEEMADVGIMLNQLALIFGDPIEQEIAKLERLERRLSGDV